MICVGQSDASTLLVSARLTTVRSLSLRPIASVTSGRGSVLSVRFLNVPNANILSRVRYGL